MRIFSIFKLIFFLMLMMSCATNGTHEVTGSPMKDEISKLFSDIDRTGDWQPLINKMADSVEFRATIPDGTPISGVFKGKAQVRNYFSRILPSVATFTQHKPMEFLSGENKVVIIGDDSYRLVVNGQTFRSPYAIVIEFDKESRLILRMTIIQDLTGIYESYKALNK